MCLDRLVADGNFSRIGTEASEAGSEGILAAGRITVVSEQCGGRPPIRCFSFGKRRRGPPRDQNCALGQGSASPAPTPLTP